VGSALAVLEDPIVCARVSDDNSATTKKKVAACLGRKFFTGLSCLEFLRCWMERCSRRKPAVAQEFSEKEGVVSRISVGSNAMAGDRNLSQKSECRLQK
jgi:hypothetical protein